MNNSIFESVSLNSRGIEKAKLICREFDQLLIKLKEHCVPVKEFSIAREKLEEACFYAKEAMGSHADNQELTKTQRLHCCSLNGCSARWGHNE